MNKQPWRTSNCRSSPSSPPLFIIIMSYLPQKRYSKIDSPEVQQEEKKRSGIQSPFWAKRLTPWFVFAEIKF
jgi:hypothetical protein